MNRYDTTPVDNLLNDAFTPGEASAILDRVIFSYLFAMLRDKDSEIAREEVTEELSLLLELRDRMRECRNV